MAGIPLALALTLLDEDNACAPFAGTQVDIWHADPNGEYSDESGEGTAGKKYLRGYQVSDANGKVAFTTVHPGRYSGRAVQMHLRFRLFDSAGTSTTYDFTTQLCFDDALTDTVYRKAPYSSRSARDTRDASDTIYGSDGASLVLALTAEGGGYAGAFTFGLSRSNQSASDASGGAGGTPPAARTRPSRPRSRRRNGCADPRGRERSSPRSRQPRPSRWTVASSGAASRSPAGSSRASRRASARCGFRSRRA